MKETESYQ